MIRQKTLAVFVLLSLASGNYTNAQEGKADEGMATEKVPLATYTLPTLTVTGERDAYDSYGRALLPGGFQTESTNFGLFGDQDLMEVPYTAQSLTEKNFATFAAPAGDVNQVLANVPSLRTGTSLIKTDFSARGMLANGSALYLNNVPGFFIMAAGPVTNTIGRADVMVGPAATLSGSVQSYNGPDGGQPVSVYLYTKRPEAQDFTRYRQTISGYGHYGGYLDINRGRLGGDGSLGVRLYAEYSDGGFAVSGAGRRKRNVFIDVSRETARSRTNLFGATTMTACRGRSGALISSAVCPPCRPPQTRARVTTTQGSCTATGTAISSPSTMSSRSMTIRSGSSTPG